MTLSDEDRGQLIKYNIEKSKQAIEDVPVANFLVIFVTSSLKDNNKTLYRSNYDTGPVVT